jgi:hypothetical protein
MLGIYCLIHFCIKDRCCDWIYQFKTSQAVQKKNLQKNSFQDEDNFGNHNSGHKFIKRFAASIYECS